MFRVTRREFGDAQHENRESETHSEDDPISNAGRQDGGAGIDLRGAHGGEREGTPLPRSN